MNLLSNYWKVKNQNPIQIGLLGFTSCFLYKVSNRIDIPEQEIELFQEKQAYTTEHGEPNRSSFRKRFENIYSMNWFHHKIQIKLNINNRQTHRNRDYTSFIDDIRISMNLDTLQKIKKLEKPILQKNAPGNPSFQFFSPFQREILRFKKFLLNEIFKLGIVSQGYHDNSLLLNPSSYSTSKIMMNSFDSSEDNFTIKNGNKKFSSANAKSSPNEMDGDETSKEKSQKEALERKAEKNVVPVEQNNKQSEKDKETNSEEVIDYSDVEIDLDPACPLCQFMRASPCGDIWITWEKCVEYHKSRDQDIVKPCSKFTLDLIDCILKNQDDFPEPLKRQLMGLPPEEEDGKSEEDEAITDNETIKGKE